MALVGFQISILKTLLKNTTPICACTGCSEQLIDSNVPLTKTKTKNNHLKSTNCSQQ